jgi:hypothetical protein
MNNYAPVVVFVFKRLKETQATFNSLLNNPEARSSDLTVYVDCWRTEEERIEVEKVADFVSTLRGFKSITVIQRNSNYGLSKSFICGITETLSKHDSAIFLVDVVVGRLHQKGPVGSLKLTNRKFLPCKRSKVK